MPKISQLHLFYYLETGLCLYMYNELASYINLALCDLVGIFRTLKDKANILYMVQMTPYHC